MPLDSQAENRDTGRSPVFPPTRWSLVAVAGKPDGSRAAEALETLCQAYWYPLYAFARRSGHSPADAQDLTQGFFHHLLETDLVGKADAEKGRFRSFLLASFRNFMSVQRARGQAAKRGGGQLPIPFNSQEAEERFVRAPAASATPEALYERSWALAILGQATGLLRAEYASPDRRLIFDQLQPFLEGDKGVLTYAEAARKLGTTEGTIKVTIRRLRQRYRDLVREVVARTVSSPTEIEEELRHLVLSLRG